MIYAWISHPKFSTKLNCWCRLNFVEPLLHICHGPLRCITAKVQCDYEWNIISRSILWYSLIGVTGFCIDPYVTVSEKTVGLSPVKTTTSARGGWRLSSGSSGRRCSSLPFWWSVSDSRWAPTLTTSVSSQSISYSFHCHSSITWAGGTVSLKFQWLLEVL